MSAYVIVSYDIVDPEKFSAYAPGVQPLLAKHGAEILVADFEAKVLEGQKRSANVVLRFDSEEAVLRFYNDPDYEPVKKIRLDSTTNGNVVIARPFMPPAG